MTKFDLYLALDFSSSCLFTQNKPILTALKIHYKHKSSYIASFFFSK